MPVYEFSVLFYCTLNSALELRIREELCGSSSHIYVISSAFEISETIFIVTCINSRNYLNHLSFSFYSSCVLFKEDVAIEIYMALNNMVMNEYEIRWKEATMHKAMCRIN
jgi:hypothetical protein